MRTPYIYVSDVDIVCKEFFNTDKDTYICVAVEQDTPLLEDIPIDYLLYADDLVLLSRSEKGLQNALNRLNDYCKDWKLNINMEKTKIIVFNKSGKIIKNNLNIDNRKIENVKTYRYLGLLFSASGKFTEAKKDLLHRGYKAMFKLTSMFKTTKPDFNTTMHLFDHIVKPVLLYGAEIWADSIFSKNDNIYNALKNEIVEQCHIKYCRYILGVNKKAPNLGVYGDTGRFPITINAAASVIKYWHRLMNLNSDYFNILKNAGSCNLNNSNIKHSWSSHLNNMLNFLSVDDHQNIHSSKSFYVNNLYKRLKNTFKNSWNKELFSDVRKKSHGNKLRTYRTFKTQFCTEDYLTKCKNEIHRKQIARFRLSAHKLNIERLRYVHPRIPPEERLCTNCSRNVCEDELHFLMECDKYNSLRHVFFEKISRHCHAFHDLAITNKFKFLCGSREEYIIKLLGDFISASFNARNN